MRAKTQHLDRGPFRAEHLHSGNQAILFLPLLPGKLLAAPGVLKNPVRVEALYDRDEAARQTLTNLLQRRGYEDLEAVLEAGRIEALASAVLSVLEARGIRITKAARERVAQCTDVAQLERWVRRAAVVQKVAETFAED